MDGSTFFSAKSGGRSKAASKLQEFKLSIKETEGARAALQVLPIKSLNAKNSLRAASEGSFNEWLFLLKQGFSLLFYGFGSKRTLLEKFGRDLCLDGGVLSVNGFASSLTIRSLLLKVASMLRKAGTQPAKGAGDAKSVLHRIQGAILEQRLYIIIHNIEGPGLRSKDAQALLSELASTPGIHLAASMDHVNTPLLWDKQTAARFNWLHLDATTYLPYTLELDRMPSLLAGRREDQRTQGAAVVLRTLVPNARQIFRLLAQNQTEIEGEIGVTFHRLFILCRERFLVGNELALRSHLTEFKDHELVQTRRGQDGTELLFAAMPDEVLQQVLQDMDVAE